MILKDISRSFKRSRLFTTVNIIGLSIGLAVSIMLILFVLNELSFDRHFKDCERIVSLNTVMERSGGVKEQIPICTRKALTEVPEKVPGIEAAMQIYRGGTIELIYKKEHFTNTILHYTEGSFFDVFSMEFLSGSKTALNNPKEIIITDKYAEKTFGGISEAINKQVTISDTEYTVTAVVKALPKNTHFTFDVLAPISEDIKQWPSIEFFTYYKIAEGMSVEDVSKAIEKEYTIIVSEFLKGFSGSAYGVVEKLTDIYLHTKSTYTLGSRSDMSFVWLLIIISGMILVLAVTNFVNLFVVQGESRLLEIGIRKTNGADRNDLIKRFFVEITVIVFIAFVIGLALSILILPYFSTLINRSLDLSQLQSFKFIISLVLLFVVTTILSASYPAFYLSKFNVLDVLAKRIRLTKRKLASFIVIFQSVLSILLLSYIFTVSKQSTYLKELPVHYNPEGVMMVLLNSQSHDNYIALEQKLLKNPDIKGVSTAGHLFGAGGSGQGIALLGEKTGQSITEYRVAPGICEIMELELVEGSFFKKDNPKNKESIVLNEAAVQMLGLNSPVVGTIVDYKGPAEIIGVVKDFMFASPQDPIRPIVLSSAWGYSSLLYIKFNETVTRQHAQQITENTFRTIDSEFVLTPLWSEDIYTNKFSIYTTQTTILAYASILSLLISMMGLLAVHSFTTARRTKEIAIRRINGAKGKQLFRTLSVDILKWVLIAGILAIPIAYFIATNWLNNYTNRITLDGWIFILPILLQLIIALLVTSGITGKVLSRNPVESLKNE